jgi:tetratricopeptide (TPR) repeat protein
MQPSAPRSAEEILADALAAFDTGGETALAQFVAAHAEHATMLQRGIRRCRELGMLVRADRAGFPERLDDFRLLRRIGGGGMGVVYEAEQMQFGRQVALKVIRPELLFFEGARERFRREVDAIAKLSHPAIVPVLASGEHDGVPYFVMELLHGVTAEEAWLALRGQDPADLDGAALRAVVSKGGHADDTNATFRGTWWQVCTRFAHQVALGMRHAHVRGIVHRDLKPSNVMLTPHGQAIVLDFGVAQFGTGRDLTRSGSTPGSPAFMSPEQLRGEATDERTDVYSLAATLWQTLALHRPFGEPKLHEQIQQGLLPSLRARNRAVPRELELVLRTAMDRDRERRYGDMGAFADDLLAVLERKPIAARPLGVGLRLLRWCQRHRVAATALLMLAAGAAVLPAALAWQQRAANAALRAEQALTEASLETSLDALHSVLVRVGNEQLRHVPQAEQAAHAALTDAAELYRKLLARHPRHQRVRAQGGRALHALAMSFERQGETQEALATAREAIAELLGDSLDCTASVLDIRAHARMFLASMLADLKEVAAAREAVDAAERDFIAAARTPASELTSLRGRANLCTTRSLLLDEREQADQVETALRDAVHLHEQVMARGSTDAKDPVLRVTYLGNLAKFLARQQRDDEARSTFETALRHARDLKPAPGMGPPPDLVLAEVQEGIGNLLARRDDPEAETYLRDCLASRERAAAQFQGNVMLRIQLGGTLHNFGNYVLQRDGPEAAIAWFERARDCQRQVLAKTPRNWQSRLYMRNHLRQLGACQARLGRGADVAATARALAELDLDRDSALAAAQLFLRAHASTDGTEGSLDLAMEQLLAAERHGLASAEPLADPVFAPLRGRADWTDLQARLAAKAAGK